jgi:hypothetical protein
MRCICSSIVPTLVLVGTVHAQPVQWTVAEGGNGHWYMGVNDFATWSTASSNAQQQGGYLATCTTVEENTFVQAVRDADTTLGGAWIGLVQLPEGSEPNGGWQWVTGEPLNWTNWTAGQPNNSANNGAEADYGEMCCDSDGWGDWANGQAIPYIIEWDHDPSIKQWRIEDGGNGHWYEAVRPEGSFCWEDARADAVSQDGYLATITSQGEQDYLEANVIDSTLGWFVGGYQDTEDPDYSEPNGAWKWVTGEPWDYTHWYSGSWGEMPNDPGGNENILALGMTWWGLMWKNAPACTDPGYNGYIIEYTVLPGSALGACCLDGLCITTASADCEGHGGTWGGADSSCADFSCPISCSGDTDGNGVVDIEDLLNMIGSWGACP